MSVITDTFFGGAEKDAARAQQAGIESGIQATKEATAEAKADINRLFPQAQASATQGFQGAADLFSQAIPAQMDAFQQGNIGAQQAILAGLPQMQNAILGGNVDLSGLQPFRVQNTPIGMFQQNVPGLEEMYRNQALQAYAPQNESVELERGYKIPFAPDSVFDDKRSDVFDRFTPKSRDILAGVSPLGANRSLNVFSR
jgi:hypothetical protein